MLSLLFGFAVLTLLAFLALSRIPRFGVSVMNVVVFVGGALLGMIGFTRLILFGIDRFFGRIVYEKLTESVLLPFGISVVGAFLGGLSFVALKTRVVNRLEDGK